MNDPNIVDWLTLIAAGTGTALTAGIGIWSALRKDREAFDAHIEWQFDGYGRYPELPFVYVQNRSAHPISIIEVSWLSGPIRKYPERGTALMYEDPTDLAFPYEIKPGESRKLFLEETGAKNAYKKVAERADRYGRVRRSSLWLRIKTMRGTEKVIAAERALPWTDQPSWITGEIAGDA